MGKKIVAVWQDLSNQDKFEPGQIRRSLLGTVRVIEPKHQNEYGEFVLCELLNTSPTEDVPVEKGVAISEGNPYEIIGTLHMPDLRHFLTVLGFFIKDRSSGKVTGYSFNEACELIFENGATNAEGIKKRYQSIEFIEGLPTFRSHYWRVQTYDENGEPFYELTAEAKKAIDRMIVRRKELDQARMDQV
jgi:hypothetical protein